MTRVGLALVTTGVLVAAVVIVGRRGESPPPPPQSVLLAGVDVSSHDRQVSWARAERSGLRFVIARATEGDSLTDTAYASTRSEAMAAGLAFTAFHYARPDRARGDAVKEADLFARVSGVGPGYLPGVLDLEESGGMSATRLQAWVKAWLEEVAAKTGGLPMIYTNADFWLTHMADATVFAEAGYPLYIASWDATVPVVPAGNWGGRGWTFWQTKKCGRVTGITGCIRTDLFNGSDLNALKLR